MNDKDLLRAWNRHMEIVALSALLSGGPRCGVCGDWATVRTMRVKHPTDGSDGYRHDQLCGHCADAWETRDRNMLASSYTMGPHEFAMTRDQHPQVVHLVRLSQLLKGE